MAETTPPKIRAGNKIVSAFDPRVPCGEWGGYKIPVYVPLRELEIQGKLTESDLKAYTGEVVVFERGDLALEGRLYLRDEEGGHNLQVRSTCDQFIITPINGHDIPCLWEKVTSGLGVKNPIHNNWEIYLKSGDKLTPLRDPLKRYELAIGENNKETRAPESPLAQKARSMGEGFGPGLF